jgi:C2H2 transcription facotor
MQQAPPSWFVYQPANDAQHRQHGHFMPSPNQQLQGYNGQIQYQNGMPYQAGYLQHHHQHPMQQQHQHQHQHQPLQPKPAFHGNMALTPMASPQPRQLKPAMAFKQEPSALQPLDTNVCYMGPSHSPCTPPLSTAGSTVSSPPCSSMPLQTPINTPYFGFPPYEVVKEEREDQYAQSFAHADWSRSTSPPMTPGK